MTDMQTRQCAHELIDRIAPSQVTAVVGLLTAMLDPVAQAIAHAPLDDEPETKEEHEAANRSKAWINVHPDEGIPLDEVMSWVNRWS